MARRAPSEAPPAFLFFGAFAPRPAILDDVKSFVVERFGPLHPRGESPVFPFPDTKTYRSSMGSGLSRRFFVVRRRWPQDGLAAVKLEAVAMEERLRRRWGDRIEERRPVNIDPGLINDCRVVLATTKDYAHRIYRGAGIWEEITLVFRDGAYRELPWTYPDFRNPDYHRFFATFRDEILAERQSDR